jgi:hypothetical protein
MRVGHGVSVLGRAPHPHESCVGSRSGTTRHAEQDLRTFLSHGSRSRVWATRADGYTQGMAPARASPYDSLEVEGASPKGNSCISAWARSS